MAENTIPGQNQGEQLRGINQRGNNDAKQRDAKAFGQALRELPIGHLIEGMGFAIANAQRALDENTVAQIIEMANTTVKTRGPEGEEIESSLLDLGLMPSFYHFTEANIDLALTLSMRSSTQSHFGMGLNVDFSHRSAPKQNQAGQPGQAAQPGGAGAPGAAGAGAGAGAAAGAGAGTGGAAGQPAQQGKKGKAQQQPGTNVAVGATLNYSETRKYGFDASAATRISARLVAVPPPGELVEASRADAAGASASNNRDREQEQLLAGKSQRFEVTCGAGTRNGYYGIRINNELVAANCGAAYEEAHGAQPPKSTKKGQGWHLAALGAELLAQKINEIGESKGEDDAWPDARAVNNVVLIEFNDYQSHRVESAGSLTGEQQPPALQGQAKQGQKKVKAKKYKGPPKNHVIDVSVVQSPIPPM